MKGSAGLYTDLLGKTRYKVNLHTHTTVSDGASAPEETLERYRAAGYDAVALTDHWKYIRGYRADGITVIGGAEYNTIGKDARGGVYHILGLGCQSIPSIEKGADQQEILNAIREAGGTAVLAHPAWSLNTAEDILRLEGVHATEIYNSVSGVHMSRRPDSSLIVDMLACRGRIYPLLASDDTHYYDSDACVSFIMAEAEENTEVAILKAVREGRFYASQGPEVHLWREGNELVVRTSPVCDIAIHSNLVIGWHTLEGEGLTEARFPIDPQECFARAEVRDAQGKRAWTNFLLIESGKDAKGI